MADGWIAFWIVWFFCGVANAHAYRDELDFTEHKLQLHHVLICIALGPITTAIGAVARTWEFARYGKWALPKVKPNRPNEEVAPSHNAGEGNG